MIIIIWFCYYCYFFFGKKNHEYVDYKSNINPQKLSQINNIGKQRLRDSIVSENNIDFDVKNACVFASYSLFEIVGNIKLLFIGIMYRCMVYGCH